MLFRSYLRSESKMGKQEARETRFFRGSWEFLFIFFFIFFFEISLKADNYYCSSRSFSHLKATLSRCSFRWIITGGDFAVVPLHFCISPV